jgi:hypothetical protein
MQVKAAGKIAQERFIQRGRVDSLIFQRLQDQLVVPASMTRALSGSRSSRLSTTARCCSPGPAT